MSLSDMMAMAGDGVHACRLFHIPRPSLAIFINEKLSHQRVTTRRRCSRRVTPEYEAPMYLPRTSCGEILISFLSRLHNLNESGRGKWPMGMPNTWRTISNR
ncbi:unnamed protein product, partial [Nesidiocoris tenuis]